MPKKPRSHQLESEARIRLKEIFGCVHGWSVEDLHQDYGEDILVRIFRHQRATPFSFYIQSKATDSLFRFRTRSSKFSVPLSKAHVRHWAKFWEPVFLTFYDSKSGKTYWECIQVFVDSEKGRKRLNGTGKYMCVDVPQGQRVRRNWDKTYITYHKIPLSAPS